MNNRDYIKSIKDIMLCLQSMIRTRFNKQVKIIFTDGRYKSAYTSFYKNYTWQFYVENKVAHYNIYLLTIVCLDNVLKVLLCICI